MTFFADGHTDGIYDFVLMNGIGGNQLKAAIGLIVVMFIGCGGGPNGSSTPRSSAPVISSLEPSTIAAGSSATSLNIYGSNFLGSTQVQLNGTMRTTTLVSSAQLKIVVEASDLASAGTLAIVVSNAVTNGGEATAQLTVTAPAAPVVASVSPETIAVGVSGATLDITGSNFVRRSVVQWNGTQRPTTYVSNTRLNASLAAADLASGAYAEVAVITPEPGGGKSNTSTVSVQYPLPSITGTTPTAVEVGSAAFVLGVSGANFAPGALVYWNGISRVTTFVSSSEVRAEILASDVAQAQVAAVTVVNPNPCAGQAAPLSFAVHNPVPVALNVIPDKAFAATRNLLISVTGSGFMSGATVRFNGVDQPTTFVSESNVTAYVDMPGVSRGNEVTVANPGPGDVESNFRLLSTERSGQGVPSIPLGADYSGMTSNGRFVWGGFNVQDTCVGAANCVPTSSRFPDPVVAVTPDGRYVARYNGGDGIVVHDTCTGGPAGCSESDTLASSVPSQFLDISDNARYLLYRPRDESTNRYFVKDTCIQGPPGCLPAAMLLGNETSFGRAVGMTPDARYVLTTTNVYDTCIGAAPGCAPTSYPVPPETREVSMSSDARYVLGLVNVTGCDPDHYYCWDIFVYDTCIGASGCTPSRTEVMTIPAANDYAEVQTVRSISKNGRYVTLVASDPNVVPNDTNVSWDVFRVDTCISAPAGCTPLAARISVTPTGEQYAWGATHGWMSDDGRSILFGVYASQYNSGDSYLAQLPEEFPRTTPAPILLPAELGWAGGAPEYPAATLKWTNVSSYGYYIVVYTNPADLLTEPDATTCPSCVIAAHVEPVKTTFWTSATPLLQYTWYYWQVRSARTDQYVNPTWSAQGKFITPVYPATWPY